MFGHQKGSFTDAKADRVGRFELADLGTLFLDEIANLSLTQQAKLLRVLQAGEFERVGSSKTRRVDVRIIAATNADLRAEVAAGRFREDLFFRLNTVELHLPPLRDRREDIPLLASFFLRQAASRYRSGVTSIDPEAMRALLAYGWPGNVRELGHAIERATLLATGDRITTAELNFRPMTDTSPRLDEMSLEDVERVLITKALARHDGNVTLAARALGLSRSALYRRLQRHGL
jgi:DNA-binding NtrC family response regulator